MISQALAGIDNELFTPGIHPNHVILVNKDNNSYVHLVGCAHVDPQSAKDVRSVAQQYTPDAVALELCSERVSLLRPPAGRSVMTEEPPEFVNLPFLIKFVFEVSAAVLGGIHGSDQIEGAKIAKENNSKLYGIDSKYSHTLNDLKSLSSMNELGKLLSAIKIDKQNREKQIQEIQKEIEKEKHKWWIFRKSRDIEIQQLINGGFNTTLVSDISRFYLPSCRPSRRYLQQEKNVAYESEDAWSDEHIEELRILGRRFFDEVMRLNFELFQEHPLTKDRDYVLAHNLWNLSKSHNSTMAVLGAAHLPGVIKHFGHTTDEKYIEKGGSLAVIDSSSKFGAQIRGVSESYAPVSTRSAFPLALKAVVGFGIVSWGLCLYKTKQSFTKPLHWRWKIFWGVPTVVIPCAAYGVKKVYDQIRKRAGAIYKRCRRLQFETCRYDLNKGNIDGYTIIKKRP